MNFKSSNFKIYLGSVYVAVLLVVIYFLFSNFDVSDLTSYEFIRENKSLILKYKESNIFFLTIIFFIITVLLNLLLCPMLLPTLVIGFIFGKWLGTLILLFGNTLGGVLLYLLAKTFFSELIREKFATKFSKFIEFFNKNEIVYFMFFRFIGGGGTPFPIQNVLPVVFNMSVKNYIFATFLGIVPTTFVTTALGSGIENIIEQNAELDFLSVFLSPEIYLPILGFFIILILSFVLKNIFFKTK
ncbi:MAG: VTT domain-containing protein [Pelagibacteraceae bacterium]|nr:VTT domain-containing protein [Pelagibacteraceae bacterium]